jgi:hypothetical protein
MTAVSAVGSAVLLSLLSPYAPPPRSVALAPPIQDIAPHLRQLLCTIFHKVDMGLLHSLHCG